MTIYYVHLSQVSVVPISWNRAGKFAVHVSDVARTVLVFGSTFLCCGVVCFSIQSTT